MNIIWVQPELGRAWFEGFVPKSSVVESTARGDCAAVFDLEGRFGWREMKKQFAAKKPAAIVCETEHPAVIAKGEAVNALCQTEGRLRKFWLEGKSLEKFLAQMSL